MSFKGTSTTRSKRSKVRGQTECTGGRRVILVLTGAVEVLGDGVQESVLGGQEPLHYRHGCCPVLKSLHDHKKNRKMRRKRVKKTEENPIVKMSIVRY